MLFDSGDTNHHMDIGLLDVIDQVFQAQTVGALRGRSHAEDRDSETGVLLEV